jgi:hypothetical protein
MNDYTLGSGVVCAPLEIKPLPPWGGMGQRQVTTPNPVGGMRGPGSHGKRSEDGRVP